MSGFGRNATIQVLAVMGVVAFASTAQARGGGITGSQGAGARTGFGPPVGIEPQPAFSGHDTTGTSVYSDGDRCVLRRSWFPLYPSYTRICE